MSDNKARIGGSITLMHGIWIYFLTTDILSGKLPEGWLMGQDSMNNGW